MRKILCFIVIFVSIFFNINMTQTNAEDFIPSSNPIIVEAFVSNFYKTNGYVFQHYSKAKFRDQIVFFNYHTTDNLKIPESSIRQSKVYKRTNFVPDVYVNGIYNYPGYMMYNDEIEKAINTKNYPIDIQIIPEKDQIVIKMKTHQKLTDLSLVALVYEDEVWQMVENDDKDCFHPYTVRRILTNPSGDYFTIQPDLLITKKYKIPIKLNRQMGIVVFVQNSKSNVIYGSGHIKVIDKPITTLYWNQYDPNLSEEDSMANKGYVTLHTGYDNMVFKANAPHHLKSINMAIDMYSAIKYFRLSHLEVYIPNTIIKFDKNAGIIALTFPEEINSDNTVGIFKLVVRCISPGVDLSFPVYKLFVNDSNSEPIGWDYIELRHYYINEVDIIFNPLDLNEDYIVDKYDLDKIIYEFGQLSKDKSYDLKYDVFPPASSFLEEDRDKHGDGRIDIQDIILVERETWIYDPPKS